MQDGKVPNVGQACMNTVQVVDMSLVVPQASTSLLQTGFIHTGATPRASNLLAALHRPLEHLHALDLLTNLQTVSHVSTNTSHHCCGAKLFHPEGSVVLVYN